MTAFLGFLTAVGLFFYCKKRLETFRAGEEDLAATRLGAVRSWHDEWHRQWARKFQRQAELRCDPCDGDDRRLGRRRRRLRRGESLEAAAGAGARSEDESLRRARRRAKAQVGFFIHLLSYLGVIAFLALINLLTTGYPWFLWAATGWGIGLFAHYMAVFGGHMVHERFFQPTIERELRREKLAMNSEKQASIDELSATIAHEIRNPIAAAKSLVQQIGESPQSVENVEYAKVAVEELDRVERRISHLLRYAKEEDYRFELINVATVVDASLTQLKARLDQAKVKIARNYIGGPTLLGDAEKLRQVFGNILDNAADAFPPESVDRRIEVFIENGGRVATVRLRDNGCGIRADQLERIFNPFFTTKEKGTGLGMAISKKIVEAHEGTIDVISEENKGAEFIVTLPLPQ